MGGATCGRRGAGRVRISEREQGRLHVSKLVSMASGDSVCPAACPAPASGSHAGQSAGRKPGIKGLTSQSGCPGALFGTLAPVRPKAR